MELRKRNANLSARRRGNEPPAVCIVFVVSGTVREGARRGARGRRADWGTTAICSPTCNLCHCLRGCCSQGACDLRNGRLYKVQEQRGEERTLAVTHGLDQPQITKAVRFAICNHRHTPQTHRHEREVSQEPSRFHAETLIKPQYTRPQLVAHWQLLISDICSSQSRISGISHCAHSHRRPVG